LMEKEAFEEGAGSDEKAAEFEERIEGLETEMETLQTALEKAEKERDRLTEESDDSGDDSERVASLESDLEEVADRQKELEKELKAIQKAGPAVSDDGGGAELAAASQQRALLESITKLIDEVNDRVSNFKNNCETVQYCVDDIRDGTDVTDNHEAATDMLKNCLEDVDAIKQTVRRFRTEKL